MKKRHLAISCAALIALVESAPAQQINTVMISGRPDGDALGPQLGPGIDWTFPEMAVINSVGQVAFQADLSLQSGISESNNEGIWRWQSGSKSLVAREGSQAAGYSAGVLFGEFSPAFALQIDDAGGILFRNPLKGVATPNNSNSYTVVVANGAGTSVARQGGLAPGLAPRQFSAAIQVRDDGPGLAGNGNVLFRAFIVGPGVTGGNDDILWYGAPGAASVLIREGDLAPAFSPTARYADSSENDAYAAGNQIVVKASVLDNGDFGGVILSGAPGSLSPVVKTGDAAPGTSGVFVSLGSARTNASGTLSIAGGLMNSDGAYPACLYLRTLGQELTPVAIGGLAAPGTMEKFFFPARNALTETGDLAFLAFLEPSVAVDSDNDSGIWIHDDGVTRLAVREGDAAGSLAGVTIGEIKHWAFNNSEELVFVSSLKGNVQTGIDDLAMWRVDANGNLSELVRLGEQFDVDPTAGVDLRTVSALNLEGIERIDDGAPRFSTLSDANQLLFGLGFTNGTHGVFTMQIPEPATLIPGLLGALSLVLVSRRV